MDLAIAGALLTASGQLDWGGAGEPPAMVGELALDGSVRPVTGVLAIAEAARQSAPPAIAVPAENGPEASLVTGIEVIPIDGADPAPRPGGRRLGSAAARAPAAGGRVRRRAARLRRPARPAPSEARARGRGRRWPQPVDIGPPGAGKSMAASRPPSILPVPGPEEALEVARIASACGRLGSGATGRPALSGAAPHDQPGGPGRRRQSAGARRGDPGPSRSALPRRALRVPPRRAGVAAGAAGDRLGLDRASRGPGSACPAGSCSSPRRTPAPAGAARLTRSAAARRLRSSATGRGLAEPWRTASTSLLRSASPALRRSAARPASPPAAVREGRRRSRPPGRSARAGPLQRRDDAGRGARVPRSAPAAATLLADAYSRRKLSGRAHDRVLRLAQTIADLAGSEEIARGQMAQALQLRRRDYE